MRSTLNMFVLVIVTLILNTGLGKDFDLGNSERIRTLFEKEYQLYLQAKEDEIIQSQRSGLGPIMGQHLGNIIQMGQRVLPYLIEKAAMAPKGEEDPFLTLPLYLLTMKSFELCEWPEGSSRDSRDKIRMYLEWWPKARKETPKEFSKRYLEWKTLKIEGKEDEAKEKLEEIRALGIAALPMLIDKIRQEDKDLIPLISTLTNGQIDPNASQSQCLSWWEQNKEDWLIPFPNKRPIANAGKDQVVRSGDTVTLDGSASSDADNDELTYRWTQISGPAVVLSSPTAARPAFRAPSVEQDMVLTFELVVSDGSRKVSVHPACQSGESEPARVNVTVRSAR